jgi:hypothetical protein
LEVRKGHFEVVTFDLPEQGRNPGRCPGNGESKAEKTAKPKTLKYNHVLCICRMNPG